MHTLEQLNQQMVEHNSHRKHFERTPEEMASAILDEAEELVAEIQQSMVTGEVWNVAGEIGDLYILLALC
jgi:NTP pyrophosphatase (non-canonical NTP hydrolase)